MKIIYFFLFIFTVASVLGNGVPEQNEAQIFNPLFDAELKYEWQEKIQEISGLSLFDELRQEVQNTRKIEKGTKTTEAIYNIGNTFCRISGNCDENSIYARLIKGCSVARDTALEKMKSDVIKNNTQLLLASYTSCYNLASDIIFAYKDAASIGIAEWNKEQIINSQENFTEKTQETFQEKVSNRWDVFKKKAINFVRSIQGFTRNVYN